MSGAKGKRSRGARRGGRRRKFVAYLATSADGYIARRDGSVDWLDRPRVKGDYGMPAFYRSIDTIVFGRKTYEVALGFQKEGIPGSAFDPKVSNIVFSRRPPRRPAPGVTFTAESPRAFARRLRATRGKNVWLMGGARLFGSFLDARVLDELVVHVIPVLIGDGIPLLSPRRRAVPLRLLSSRRFSDGVVRLRYAVGAPRRGRPR